MLCAVDEHYNLHREMPTESSQLQFKRDEVYCKDFVTKTHDRGIADRKNDRKEVWVFPNDNPQKCTVRLVEKYLSLCPVYYKKSNFYLQALQKPTPKQWYSEQVMGYILTSKAVKELLEKAKSSRFFYKPQPPL